MPWILKFMCALVIAFFGLLLWGLSLPDIKMEYVHWEPESPYQTGTWGNKSDSTRTDIPTSQPSVPKVKPDRKALEETYTTPLEQEIEDMEWEDLKQYMAD